MKRQGKAEKGKTGSGAGGGLGGFGGISSSSPFTPTWVFACGTYRSASTTQYQMTRDIVEQTGNGIGIGYHQEVKLRDYDIAARRLRHKFIVCKVFVFLPNTSQYGRAFLDEGRLKAVCTVRNPLDIITSMRERHRRHMEDPRHQKEPFDFHHRATVDFPQWLGQLTDWIDLGPDITHVARYEEFTEDLDGLRGEVQAIADHLGIVADRKLLERIARQYERDAIMARKKVAQKRRQREDPNISSISGILFGRPGSHLHYLVRDEIDLVTKHNYKFMERFGYI